MASVREYLLSVITAAIICSLVSAMLPGKGSVNTIIKVICGVFLTITVISPVVQLDFTGLSGTLNDYFTDGEAIASQGQFLAEEEIGKIMESRIIAFINQIAAENGAELDVAISLDIESMQPTQVILTGKISPYAKQKMQSTISRELGVSEVNIIWN